MGRLLLVAARNCPRLLACRPVRLRHGESRRAAPPVSAGAFMRQRLAAIEKRPADRQRKSVSLPQVGSTLRFCTRLTDGTTNRVHEVLLAPVCPAHCGLFRGTSIARLGAPASPQPSLTVPGALQAFTISSATNASNTVTAHLSSCAPIVHRALRPMANGHHGR